MFKLDFNAEADEYCAELESKKTDCIFSDWLKEKGIELDIEEEDDEEIDEYPKIYKPVTKELVDKFNIYYCRKKNWLPPNYGKASYSDMNQEERAVVDGFHGDGTEGTGESAYQAVMLRSDYYLAEPKNEVPALTAGT